MGKGGKGSSGNTPSGFTSSTQNTSPWAGQQPFLVGGMGNSYTIPGTNVTNVGPESTIGIMPAAASLYSNYTPQYFHDSTVSPFTQGQSQGLQNEVNFGLGGGSSSVGAANNALTAINSGALLSVGNPYFQNMANAIGQGIAPTLNSSFEANGRYGSGANVNALSSTLANAIAPLAFQNYQSGINNIIQSSGISPLIQQGQIQGMDIANTAGQQQQQQNQAQLNDQINRFNFEQQLPYNKLSAYESAISGTPGGSSSMLTQPFFSQNSGGKGGKGGQVAGIAAEVLPALAIAGVI